MSQRTFSSEAHIVGGGITGLVSALELADQKISLIISDVAGEISGRARTIKYQGQSVNLGPNWWHDDMLLEWMRERYTRTDKSKYDAKGLFRNIEANFFRDRSEHSLTVMLDGIRINNDLVDDAHEILHKNWIEISADGHDHSLAEVARGNDLALRFAHFMARNWLGLSNADQASAREYFSDESAPGGHIPKIAFEEIFKPIKLELKDLGIPVYKSAISAINRADAGYNIANTTGEIYKAQAVLVTASSLPLQKISFDRPLVETPEIAKYLHDVIPTHLTKIVCAFDPNFFTETTAASIKPNTHIRILSADTPYFAFARPLGAPMIILFTAGDEAVRAERWKPEQVKNYVRQAFGHLHLLKGFEVHLTGNPLVTKHATIPRFGESFSALRIGGERPGRVLEHTPGVFIANADMASLTEGAATMSGACVMGRKAAKSIRAHLANLRPA